MPRTYVNAVGRFSIEGGMVSFTLRDAREPGASAAEDVIDVVMRERDFLEMLGTMQNHVERHRAASAASAGPERAGAAPQGSMRLGDPPPRGGPSQPMGGPMVAPGPASGRRED